jgi:ubiquinone/menaquinone biosynthesis C-methylase UbiE
MTNAAAGLAASFAIFLGALAWRRASAKHQLPCPSSLAWLLENPYTSAIAGSEMLLDRAKIGTGMRVLDVGAGPGRVSIPAAERVGPAGEVVAVDIQAAMLDRLQRRVDERGLKNVRTVYGSVESLAEAPELSRAGFDRALLVTVLGEIPQRDFALTVIHEKLRAGGILSVTEFVPDPHFQAVDPSGVAGKLQDFNSTVSMGLPLHLR